MTMMTMTSDHNGTFYSKQTRKNGHLTECNKVGKYNDKMLQYITLMIFKDIYYRLLKSKMHIQFYIIKMQRKTNNKYK